MLIFRKILRTYLMNDHELFYFEFNFKNFCENLFSEKGTLEIAQRMHSFERLDLSQF